MYFDNSKLHSKTKDFEKPCFEKGILKASPTYSYFQTSGS